MYIHYINRESRRKNKMPGQDRTGPMGAGPLTGRGLGPCGRGSGFGFRRGFGMGFGRRTITSTEEKEILQDELKAMEQEKTEIEKRLKEIK